MVDIFISRINIADFQGWEHSRFKMWCLKHSTCTWAIDMLGIDFPPTQENFNHKMFPFDKYFLWVSAFRKTLPRIHKTTNRLTHKAYLKVQTQVSLLLCSNWLKTLHFDFFPERDSCVRRNHKIKDYTILFLQGLSLLLVARSPWTPWVHRPSAKGSGRRMISVFRLLIFHSDTPTHWIFPCMSALNDLLTSDKISSLFGLPTAGNAVLLC